VASDFRGRTRTKLDYAKIHLDEVRDNRRHDAFERAHYESVLFHVVSAKDSFLQEINDAYKKLLEQHEVNERRLGEKLKEKDLQCQAFNRLLELKNDETSWLAQTIALRNQGTHRFHISLGFHEGDEFDGQVFFIDPRTRQEVHLPVVQFLEECIREMTQLIEDLRDTLERETDSWSPPVASL
jgi:hypothetical protein